VAIDLEDSKEYRLFSSGCGSPRISLEIYLMNPFAISRIMGRTSHDSVVGKQIAIENLGVPFSLLAQSIQSSPELLHVARALFLRWPTANVLTESRGTDYAFKLNRME
jgi:hypothetical protein